MSFLQVIKAHTRFYALAQVPDGEIVVMADTWSDTEAESRSLFHNIAVENCERYGADPSTIRYVQRDHLTPEEQVIVRYHWVYIQTGKLAPTTEGTAR